uniref:Uncharacterized protein n=1 Tax=Oryza brachyantha TaxID=4533 RepID=J3LPS6_ORYBR
MHQRRQHGSSGELDVFGATRYFAGLATARRIAAVVREPEDMIIQVKATSTSSDDDGNTNTEEGHHAGHGQLAAAGVAKTNRSKLAAFLGFSLQVSPEATSFRKKSAPESSVTTPTYADHQPKLAATSSPAASSRHGDDDLGAAAMWEDRRLQGVRVVRCGGCDEERWVVRCGGGWGGGGPPPPPHHDSHEKAKAILDAAASRSRYGSQVQGDQEVVGDGSDWESDSSSDLFELDLDST